MSKLSDKFKKQEESNNSLINKLKTPASVESDYEEDIPEFTGTEPEESPGLAQAFTSAPKELDRELPDLPPEDQINSVADLDKFSKEVRTGLNKENQAWLKDQTAKLKELNEEAKKIYEKDKSRIDKARLGAIIAKGLSQIGYGISGLKSGVSAGPLKFDKADWTNSYNNILQEYKSELRQGEKELDSESKEQKSASQERSRLGEERINRAELMLRLQNKDIDEAKRQAERLRREAAMDAKKKGKDPKEAEEKARAKALEATKKDFRKIEKLKEQVKEADSDKEATRLMGDIFVLLNQEEGAEKSISELKELGESDGRPWYDFFSEKKDLLGDYISSVKDAKLKALQADAQEESPQEEPLSEGKTEITTPDGRVMMIPNENLDKAIKAGAKVNK